MELVLREDSTNESFSAVKYFFVLMGHHGKANTMGLVWESVLSFDKLAYPTALLKYTELVYIWTGLRKGSRISNSDAVLARITFLMKNHYQTGKFEESVMIARLLAVYLSSCSFDQVCKTRSLLDIIMSHEDISVVLIFYETLHKQSMEHFGMVVLPEILS